MAYTTVNKHSDHFRVKNYTGNGAYGNNITFDESGNMQPDIVWIKQRGGSSGHHLYDSVRGPDKRIRPDSNQVESTNVNMLHSYDTNGFTIDDDSGINSNGGTFTSWNWKAGGAAPTQTYKVVVVSDSGNKYRFRNSADTATFGASAVTLDLQEGGTYTFDVSDSTMNSHPFVIGTAANSSEYSTGVTYKLDGVTKTYSQYTSGFSAATSRQLIITVAASAPALYYWCSQHSGMGGAINTNSTFGSSNFDGSVQSTVSANTTSGFSIIKWTGNAVTGTTIGHDLGVKPNLIILKNRGPDGASWQVYHSSLGATKYLQLNSNGAESTSNTRWNDTEPTSTVFTTGSSGDVKGDNSGEPFVAWCFANKTGFLKVGTYVGNGNADGTFVYTGFRPSFLLTKTTATDGWRIIDDKRLGYNPNNSLLQPHITQADSAQTWHDLVSNGFKLRTTDTGDNANGTTYIYMAIGQSIVGSNNIPATAR